MRLIGPSSIRESTHNGVDYTPNLLDGFLFLWRLSITSQLVVSLSSSIFYFVSSSIRIVIPMLTLLVSSRSHSCLVIVRSLNKLG